MTDHCLERAASGLGSRRTCYDGQKIIQRSAHKRQSIHAARNTAVKRPLSISSDTSKSAKLGSTSDDEYGDTEDRESHASYGRGRRSIRGQKRREMDRNRSSREPPGVGKYWKEHYDLNM